MKRLVLKGKFKSRCTFKVWTIDEGNMVEVTIYSCYNRKNIVDTTICEATAAMPWLLAREDW